MILPPTLGLCCAVLVNRPFVAALVVTVLAAIAGPAVAQRLPFERTIDVTPGATLDVATFRGKVNVTGHDARQIRIDGTVTIRPASDFRTTQNPMDVARRVADRPRIEVNGNVVRLRPPLDADELRVTTVSYDVRVPRDTRVIIAHHDTVIEPDDHVIVFVVNKRMVPRVEKLFQVDLGFF